MRCWTLAASCSCSHLEVVKRDALGQVLSVQHLDIASGHKSAPATALAEVPMLIDGPYKADHGSLRETEVPVGAGELQ